VCLFCVSVQILVQVFPRLRAQLDVPKNVLRPFSNLELERI